MKRNILCTLAVMAACAILVACGKTDDQISPITPESNAASSEAEATPEPPPTLAPDEAHRLTREAKGAKLSRGPAHYRPYGEQPCGRPPAAWPFQGADAV